jgi:site-specific DNA recombinase
MKMAKLHNDEAVILARVSGKDQEADGYSLPAQEKLLVDYCSRTKLGVDKIFVIAEKASRSDQRLVFASMMEYVKKNNIKIIVVEKVDRFVRNFKDVVMTDEWLAEDEERKLHFVKDSLILHKYSRSQETLNWGIRVVIAKNYIDNLKEEVEKGVKEKIAQGWYPGAPPLGYKTVGEEGHKQHYVDHDIAPLIVKLFNLYLDPSHSISTVTAEMERLGLRTRKGKRLVRTHIRKLLTHKFYIGMLPWVGKVYPGAHEAIITLEVFRAVQDKLDNKNVPKYFKHNSLLKGQVTCKYCGRMITWEEHKGVNYGRCKACKNKFARLPEIEAQLLSGLDNLLAPSNEIADWVRQYIRERHENDMETYLVSMRKLKQRHEDLARRINLAYDDRSDGRITTEFYDKKVAAWTSEQEAILEQLDKFDKTYAAKLEHDLDILELSQRAKEIYDIKKDVEQRRALLREIYSNLTLDGQSLDYTYTEHVQAISNKVDLTRELKTEFEQANNPSTKAKEAFNEASKTIWLGLWSDFRTIDYVPNEGQHARIRTLLSV